MEAKRYYSLDALKFSCAICIVFIHFEILYTESLVSHKNWTLMTLKNK